MGMLNYKIMHDTANAFMFTSVKQEPNDEKPSFAPLYIWTPS